MKLKTKLRDPMGKQRNEVTKFIAQNQSRQEFVPPLGKYVDLLKAEPLHITNNAWQSWFLTALAIVMHYTNLNHLKAETAVSDLPDSSPVLAFLRCLKDTLKCGRLHKAFLLWSVRSGRREFHSHIDSQDLNQSASVGNLPL